MSMMKEPKTFRVAQKIFITNEKNELFVVRFASISTNPKTLWGKWDFPGGGVEIDESLDEGIQREIREEIGNVEIEIGRPILYWDFWMKDFGKEHIRTVAIGISGKWKSGNIVLNEEHDAFRWISTEEILGLDWDSSHKRGLRHYLEYVKERVV